MSKALILYAHPCPESFNAAVHGVVLSTLTARGITVDNCDLYAEGFNPVMSEEERRGYHDEPINLAPVQPYVERLRAVDTLVMVYPVWNFGYPAILKGFIDRVFIPGVGFKLHDGGIRPGLDNIKRLAACVTYGGTRFRAMLNADPPRKIITRSVRYACGMPSTRYVALYDMNRNKAPQLTAHLERVQREMNRL